MFKFWVLDHLTREAWLWAWQRDLPIQETLPKTSLCENQTFHSPSFRLVVAFCCLFGMTFLSSWIEHPKLETPLRIWTLSAFSLIHFTLVCYAKVPHVPREHVPFGKVKQIFHIYKTCDFHMVKVWIAQIWRYKTVLIFFRVKYFSDTSLWPFGLWSEARICFPRRRSRAVDATTLHILFRGRGNSSAIYTHGKEYRVSQKIP